MITRDLRHAIARAVAAAGLDRGADPGLRPTGTPGRYAASVALALGPRPRETAEALAGTLARERWIAKADVTGPGYLTITVTPEALAAVAGSITQAGPACVTSNALAGMTVPGAPLDDPLAALTWEKAATALAARLAARLAGAAGATVRQSPAAERSQVSHPARTEPPGPQERPSCRESPLAPAVAFAGRDAVTFTLARAVPGQALVIEPEVIARHVPGNPAYAVRYAHARAASGMRWAANSSAADTIGFGDGPQRLLDALSWLPERVVTAARRGRPDEFARYLEDLASVTVDVLSSPSHPGKAAAPGSDRLALARAAQTGLAAGLGLLEVSAPDRL